jgi:tRNA (guanine6-N2)-methyltransferase
MPNIKYYVLTVPGLEDVSWKEIESKLEDVSLTNEELGKLSFTYSGDPADLLQFRSVENVFIHIGTIPKLTRSRNSLGDIFRHASRFDLEMPLKIHKDVHGGKGKKKLTFKVVSTMIGRNNFRRVDAQSALESALTTKYDWKLNFENPILEFRIDLVDDTAIFGLKLTDARIHRKTYKTSHVPASLKPTVAHCIALLSDPSPSDVFIDPMCGAGTIAIERAFAAPFQQIIAGDVQKNIIESAKDNIESSHRAIDLMLWDVSSLPLKDHSVDRVVCNLPFGKQTGSQTENQYLYMAFFREVRRIIKARGKAVLLTTERDLMDDIISRHTGVYINKRFWIDLSGLKTYIYVLYFR